MSTLDELIDMKELLLDWLVLLLRLVADLEANEDVLMLFVLLNREVAIFLRVPLFFPFISMSDWSDFFYLGYLKLSSIFLFLISA